MQNNILSRDLINEHLLIEKGEGCYIFDKNGNQYLDAVGGAAVVNCGHSVPEIVQSIYEQLKKLCYVNSSFSNQPKIELAEQLSKLVPKKMGKVKTIFCSGGSEATESALKMARQFNVERNKLSKYKIISRWLSYHGNTLGALSMSGRLSWRAKYIPLLLDFPHIPPPYCYRCWYNKQYPHCNLECAWELERIINFEGQDSISAFICEPIIGTTATGVTPPNEYFEIIRQICDKYNVLLIVDEVITGLGRTGKNFGINHWNISPDMIVVGKGLSGGYTPLAGLIVSEEIWKVLANGSGGFDHSFTYSGNPLSCAAGKAVLDYMQEKKLIKRSEEMGNKLFEKLQSFNEIDIVGDIRGKGLLQGIEFVCNKQTKKPFPSEKKISEKIVKEAFKRGLLVISGLQGTLNGIEGDHIQITPPYIINEEQIDFLVKTLKESILEVEKSEI